MCEASQGVILVMCTVHRRLRTRKMIQQDRSFHFAHTVEILPANLDIFRQYRLAVRSTPVKAVGFWSTVTQVSGATV